jgi:hypothetical protein
MSSLLDEACAILDDFEKKVDSVKADWEQIAADNPHLEQVSSENWQETYYRMWLHGVTNIWERNELGRWLTDYPPATEVANAPAQKIYNAWHKWLSVAGPVKVVKVLDCNKRGGYIERESKQSSEAFYAEHDRFEIQEPLNGETLYEFIIRLARSFEDAHDRHQKRARKDLKIGTWLEERALKSFLDFIRKNNSSEQVAFIEHIFPQKMDMHFGSIIRLISPEAHPIPEKTAAEILIALAEKCQNGRIDARHTALEGLALSWLCIACSRIRLPKTLEIVRTLSAEAVLSGAEFGVSKNRTFGQVPYWRSLEDEDFSVLQVPTWFGNQPLKISNRLATFLKIIADIPSKKTRTTIFQKSRKSLDQMFSSALQVVAPDPKYGKITYLSLLINQPHIHGDHRTQPNNKILK